MEIKPSYSRFVLMLLLLLTIAAPVQGGSLKEGWYLSRGKANMQIKNYKAAIEAFEKLVALNPKHQEGMRLLGTAYERQGLTDKAIGHYDRYLKRFPRDFDVAFKQARYLEAERYRYRREDAIGYYRLGLKQRDDAAMRYRLARLLSAEKKHLADAVATYEKLLADDPGNARYKKEYRDLLVWDDRFLDKAITAYEAAVQEIAGDDALERQLAELYFKSPRRRHRQPAVDSYADLASRHPGENKLRVRYAQSLARIDAYAAVASEQFQKALEQKELTDTHLLYADHLARRTATREAALTNYQKVIAKRPDDLAVRFKYARLLGADKADAPEAIAAYQEILRQDPRSGTAHRELGKAYAWEGDNDRAIHHANLALRYDREDRTARRLRGDLMEGREPRVWSGLGYLHQGGDDNQYRYDGYRIFVAGQMDVIPFLTVGVEAGRERYDGDGDDPPEDAEAGVYQLALQYRLDPEHRVDARLRYYDFDEAGNDAAVRLQFTFPKGDWWIGPGLRRELRYDSLLALREVDDAVTGDKIGGARTNAAFCELRYEGERLGFSFTPYAGFVSSEGADDNLVGGVDIDTSLTLFESGGFELGAAYLLVLAHYDEDQSGFTSADEAPAGGYYSPDFYMNNTLGLELTYHLDQAAERELHISGGPSFQYSQEHDVDAEWDTGGALQATFQTLLAANLELRVAGQYRQMADVYQQAGGSVQVAYHFR